jgi:hypothetical protein
MNTNKHNERVGGIMEKLESVHAPACGMGQECMEWHGVCPDEVRVEITTLIAEAEGEVIKSKIGGIEQKIRLLSKESGKQDGTNTKAVGVRIQELRWVLKHLKKGYDETK